MGLIVRGPSGTRSRLVLLLAASLLVALLVLAVATTLTDAQCLTYLEGCKAGWRSNCCPGYKCMKDNTRDANQDASEGKLKCLPSND